MASTIDTPAPAPDRGAATRGQVGRQVAGVDAIEVKATVADGQIDLALDRYGLTIDNDEERYIYFFDTPEQELSGIRRYCACQTHRRSAGSTTAPSNSDPCRPE